MDSEKIVILTFVFLGVFTVGIFTNVLPALFYCLKNFKAMPDDSDKEVKDYVITVYKSVWAREKFYSYNIVKGSFFKAHLYAAYMAFKADVKINNWSYGVFYTIDELSK